MVERMKWAGALLAVMMAFSVSAEGFGGGAGAPPGKADILGGDEGEACQMKLCLSNPAGENLEDCQEPLRKYFRMEPEDRPPYLAKCPMVKGMGQGD